MAEASHNNLTHKKRHRIKCKPRRAEELVVFIKLIKEFRLIWTFKETTWT